MENKITEEELLRLKLNHERGGRINSELTNLELVKQKLQVESTQLRVEQQASFNTLKEKYSLGPQDQITDNGTIIRKQEEEEEEKD